MYRIRKELFMTLTSDFSDIKTLSSCSIFYILYCMKYLYLLPALYIFLILHTSNFILLLFYLPLFHTVYLSFLTPQLCIFSFSYLPVFETVYCIFLSFLQISFFVFFPLSFFFFLYTSIFLLLHLSPPLPHGLCFFPYPIFMSLFPFILLSFFSSIHLSFFSPHFCLSLL